MKYETGNVEGVLMWEVVGNSLWMIWGRMNAGEDGQYQSEVFLTLTVALFLANHWGSPARTNLGVDGICKLQLRIS